MDNVDLERAINNRLVQAERLWLFLDYDGTLAPFAPNPDLILPDPTLIQLISQLVEKTNYRISIISGRRLAHIQALLPVSGLIMAGTYGIEMQLSDGKKIVRAVYEDVRPAIEALKPKWETLIAGRKGFYLEDKGWALALHARFAEPAESEAVLSAALADLQDGFPTDRYRILGGHKFLEIGSALSNKGQAVAALVKEFPFPGALLVYIGDDDKDEEAFAMVKALGGIAVLVASVPRSTEADFTVSSPQEVRRLLFDLV